MNTPFIITFPPTIRRHFKPAISESHLVNRVLAYSRANAKIPDALLERLPWYPDQLAKIILTGALSLDTLPRLLKDPYVAFKTVMERPNLLCPLLEELYVRNNAVGLELLIQHGREYPRRSLLTEEEYLALLAKIDPSRRIRLETDESKWPALVNEFASAPEAQNPTTAAWAYFKLSLQKTLEIDPSLLAVLATDEEYLFRAAHLLKNRAAKAGQQLGADAAIAELVSRIKDPRWAFHVLRDGLAKDAGTERALLAVVNASPAWAVELMSLPIWSAEGILHGGGVRPSGKVLEFKYLDIVRESAGHPCTNDLHFWILTVLLPDQATIMRKFSQLTTPAAAA